MKKMAKVELVKAEAFELNPAKRYLILVPEDVSKDTLHELNNMLNAIGITNLIASVKNPKTVKLVEMEASK